MLLFVPWLDTRRVRSAKYRPIYKWFFWLLRITCLALGYLGAKPAEGVYVIWARIFTVYYFAHFLVVMPIVGMIETPTEMPRSITDSVLRRRLALRRRGPPLRLPRSAERGTPHDQSRQTVRPSRRWPPWRHCSSSPAGSVRGRRARAHRAPDLDLRRLHRPVRPGASLQRGFQVYKDVCSACHGLKRVYFRNLVQPGGPEFPEESVKALAAAWPNQITDGPNDNGKMFERPAKLSDPILGPYKNDKEARAAQNGALPPDLSLIAKARNVEYTGPGGRIRS